MRYFCAVEIEQIGQIDLGDLEVVRPTEKAAKAHLEEFRRLPTTSLSLSFNDDAILHSFSLERTEIPCA